MPRVEQAELDQAFSSLTRKHIHKLASKTLAESSNIQWEIPKTRYLTKIGLLVEGTYTMTHASETSYTLKRLAPQRFISNVQININNGFSPFKISGAGAYLMNLINPRNTAFSTLASSASTRGANIATLVSSSGGTSNTIKFYLEFPLTINERDYMGIINAGDSTTNIVLEIDTGTILGLLATTTGFTTSSVSITGTPFLETLSQPDNPYSQDKRDHMLDISLVKLVHGQSKTIGTIGEDITNIPRGTVYRKFIIDTHASDTPLTDAQVSKIQLALNQADTLFDLTGKQFQCLNQKQLGYALPDGVWAWDLSYQGNPNYGGHRDLIDSDSINEFWAKLQFETTGTFNYYYECIARMM
jgi:hypothetical protein